jgi:hypothetical protein
MPDQLRRSVELIRENCEPALSTVLFMAGAGGSLRSGVTENPVRLTRSVKDALTLVTCGGAPTYVWPGGGITFMVDVTRVPENAFGYVPTPALVAPIEFTLRLEITSGSVAMSARCAGFGRAGPCARAPLGPAARRQPLATVELRSGDALPSPSRGGARGGGRAAKRTGADGPPPIRPSAPLGPPCPRGGRQMILVRAQ